MSSRAMHEIPNRRNHARTTLDPATVCSRWAVNAWLVYHLAAIVDCSGVGQSLFRA